MATPPHRLGGVIRPLAARLGLLLLGLVLAAAVSEAVLRTFRYSGSRRVGEVDPEARDLPEIQGMAGLLEPNARGRDQGVLYTTNSAGFRGPEIAVAKPPGTFRIVIVGDSFTMGSGVRYEETYAALLSEALNRSDDPRHYEVLNLGISGFTLYANVARLKRVGLRFDPDLVVYGFTVNDIEGPFYRKPRVEVQQRRGTPLRLINLLVQQWIGLRNLVWHPPGSYLWELDENYFRNPQAWGAWKDDLADLARTADARSLCVGMLLHTQLEYLYGFHPFRPYYEAARTEAERLGMPVFESFPYFENRRAESLWVDYLDHHPNAEGHRILARALLDGLAGLPARCWRGPRPSALERPPGTRG